MTVKLGLVSWGRKGASRRLLETTARLLDDYGVDYCVSTSSSNPSTGLLAQWPSSTIRVAIPRHRASLPISYRLRERAAADTLCRFEQESVSRVLVLMPHPWDMYLQGLVASSSMEFFMILHDARKHAGDFWPRESDMDLRARNVDCAVFFSEAVAAQMSDRTRRYRVCEHPALVKSSRNSMGQSAPKLVVFAGRVRAYKGLDLLMEAWASHDFEGARLVIAGEGRLRHVGRATNVEATNVDVINRWLSDDELEQLIASATVVVLPYREASQSGIVPLARALGVPVVVTPVGGLPEQFLDGVEGIVTKDVSAESLAAAIQEALERPWVTRPNSSANYDYVKCILT